MWELGGIVWGIGASGVGSLMGDVIGMRHEYSRRSVEARKSRFDNSVVNL